MRNLKDPKGPSQTVWIINRLILTNFLSKCRSDLIATLCTIQARRNACADHNYSIDLSCNPHQSRILSHSCLAHHLQHFVALYHPPAAACKSHLPTPPSYHQYLAPAVQTFRLPARRYVRWHSGGYCTYCRNRSQERLLSGHYGTDTGRRRSCSADYVHCWRRYDACWRSDAMQTYLHHNKRQYRKTPQSNKTISATPICYTHRRIHHA